MGPLAIRLHDEANRGKSVANRTAILEVVQENYCGKWSTTIWLSENKGGTFTCTAHEDTQDDGAPRGADAKQGLKNGRDVYKAVRDFAQEFDLFLTNGHWLRMVKTISGLNPEIGIDFLAAHTKTRAPTTVH